jgi:hypothetical protein
VRDQLQASFDQDMYTGFYYFQWILKIQIIILGLCSTATFKYYLSIMKLNVDGLLVGFNYLNHFLTSTEIIESQINRNKVNFIFAGMAIIRILGKSRLVKM